MDKKIGELIQERVKSQKLDVTEFAKLINKERSNVYNIFNRSSIDTDLLKKIGQVLDYDFFQEFLEPETIQKILMTHSLDNEIYVKIKLSNSEMSKISLQEKVIKTFIKE
jgi:transcriptional regulator with XRE-family HTH domain